MLGTLDLQQPHVPHSKLSRCRTTAATSTVSFAEDFVSHRYVPYSLPPDLHLVALRNTPCHLPEGTRSQLRPVALASCQDGVTSNPRLRNALQTLSLQAGPDCCALPKVCWQQIMRSDGLTRLQDGAEVDRVLREIHQSRFPSLRSNGDTLRQGPQPLRTSPVAVPVSCW